MAAGAGVTAAAEEESTSFVLDPDGHFYVQDQFAIYANGVRRSDNKVFGVDLRGGLDAALTDAGL